MTSIQYSISNDQIVHLQLDAPGEPVNTMNAAFQADLATVVARLEASRDSIKGVILTSGKPTFFAGGDLRSLMTVTPGTAQSFFEGIEAMKANLRRLEKLGRPIVAAINGAALGGGLELALSCHHRICLDDDRIQLGFPEVTLGLLPGAGGVTKSVRIMGIQAAMPYIAEGKRATPREALEVGYVDALAPDRAAMMFMARAWIDSNSTPKQPWDDPEYKIPGGTPSSPAEASMLASATAVTSAKTRGNYPAPEAVMAAAIEGAQVDFDTALRIESRYLAKLATGQVAKNMIGTLFFQMNEVKAGGSRPAEFAKSKVSSVGVLGAGMMGSGIAWACASKGIPCVLLDTSLERAEQGKSYTAKLLARRVAQGRTSESQAQQLLSLVKPTDNKADLSECDLVIEAVFEDKALKAEVTREIEACVKPDAIFASNTSTLPISSLAQASVRPAQFIGLHFFSPVDKMDLVEIIKGRKTSPATLAKAYDFVLQIGKTPIVVNDARGFYTSRVFGSFVNEGMALLGEGVQPAVIENIGMQIGMPVGPLAVLDEVSLKLADDVLHQELHELANQAKAAGAEHVHGPDCDHGHDQDHGHDDKADRSPRHQHGEHAEHGHVQGDDQDHQHEHPHEHAHVHGPECEHDHDHKHDHKHEHKHEHKHDHDHDHAHKDAGSHHHHDHKVKSQRMAESAVYVLEKMAHGYKRMGRAYGGGFYEYPEGGEKELWPGLKVFARGAKKVPPEDVRDRLLYSQAVETVRCLEEGVLESTRDANIGSILGWGFPAYTGGTAQFVNHVGVREFCARCDELAQKYGERFTPPRLLRFLASQGTPLN